MAWLAMSLRRLRDERVGAVGFVVLVLATASVLAIAPLLLGHIADEALRTDMTTAAASTRNIELDEIGEIAGGPPTDPLAQVTAEGARLEAGLPAGIRDLIVDRGPVADTTRWVVDPALPRPSELIVRVQPGAEKRIRLVDGRLPTAVSRTVPDETSTEGTVELPVFEVAVSNASADGMGVRVGDLLQLRRDLRDPLNQRASGRVAVEIVGIFDVVDPTDPFWFDDTSLAIPTVDTVDANNDFLQVTALASPEAYPLLVHVAASTAPGYGFGAPVAGMRYAWRYVVDPERVAASAIDPLIGAVRQLQSVYPSSVPTLERGRARSQTGLLGLLEGHQARWGAAAAVLAVGAIGAAAISVSALALVALLASGRRRTALAVSRARGASPGQALTASAVEGSLLTAPPTAVGLLVAVALFPAGDPGPSLLLALALAVVTTGLVVRAVLPAAVGLPHGRAPSARSRRAPSHRRLVLEGLAVVLAVVGAILLRDRGLQGSSSAAALVGPDPFVAAVPVLVGLAAGLIVVRLLPLPLAGLARLAGLRRDLVPVHALRRATRAGAGATILLVLLATATVGGFAAATVAHLDRAATDVAWQEVGAAYRLDGPNGPLPARFDRSALPGAQAVAGAYRTRATVGLGGPSVDTLALDAGDYEAVVAGTPGDPGLPAELLQATSGPLPVILSTEATTGPSAIDPAAPFDLIIDGLTVTARAIAVRANFPSMPVGGRFIVLAREQLQATRPDAPVQTTSLYIRANDDAAPGLRAGAMQEAPGSVLAGRAEETARIRASSVVVAVSTGVVITAAVAGLYAALGVAASLALAGSARAGEDAHLRTLGLSTDQTVGLVVAEHVPIVVLATIGGAALGLALFLVLRPSLGLGALVGSALPIPFSIQPAELVIVGLIVLAIAGGGVGLAAWIERRTVPATAIRRGIE